MGARIETKKGFVDHFIDCSVDPKSFLARLEALVDWKPFEKYLRKNVKRAPQAAAGQPAYPDLVMFKALLLQFLYGLSDDSISEALGDRISFIHFIGLPFDSSKPDASTVCRFRNRLLENGHHQHLLELFNQQLEASGLKIRRGVAVDATLIPSSRRPRKVLDIESAPRDRHEDESTVEVEPEAKVSYSDDVDATWTVKGGKAVHGYKAHMAVDLEYGFILGGHVTGANKSDTKELPQVVAEVKPEPGALVEGDKGYASEENRAYLREHGFQDGLMRKAYRNRPLKEWEKKFNRMISKTRWRVEQAFGVLKQVQGLTRARYLGTLKVDLEVHLQSLAFNMRRAVNLCLSS